MHYLDFFVLFFSFANLTLYTFERK